MAFHGSPEACHLCAAVSRGHRAGGKAKRARSAVGDESGFGSGKPGDARSPLLLECMNRDEVMRGLFHRTRYARIHQSAAQSGDRSDGVDERADAEALVDGRGLESLGWRGGERACRKRSGDNRTAAGFRRPAVQYRSDAGGEIPIARSARRPNAGGDQASSVSKAIDTTSN
jgi:hypothetical protein